MIEKVQQKRDLMIQKKGKKEVMLYFTAIAYLGVRIEGLKGVVIT